MKLTKSKLKQIIKEELGGVLREKKTKITAKPIEGWVGLRAFTNKALEIIKSADEVGYNELKKWLFDNHDVDDDEWLRELIERVLKNKRLLKYYDQYEHKFVSFRPAHKDLGPGRDLEGRPIIKWGNPFDPHG